MEAGKHVMCEKPVGAEVAELERLQSVAEKSGVVLMPGHNYVYEPPLCAVGPPPPPQFHDAYTC
jgi:predicted dehydrogenase